MQMWSACEAVGPHWNLAHLSIFNVFMVGLWLTVVEMRSWQIAAFQASRPAAAHLPFFL
jgi:hypothetical protein